MKDLRYDDVFNPAVKGEVCQTKMINFCILLVHLLMKKKPSPIVNLQSWPCNLR